MKATLPLSLALVVALTACNKPAEPPAAQADAATTPPPAADTAAPVTAPPIAPDPTVVTKPADDPLQQASLSGYGDMKLGSSSDEARKAWGGELKALGNEADVCHYLVPKWAKDGKDLAFMIESGKFVRYESARDKEVAPGGGKVGMSVDQLKPLYPNLQAMPHKYVEGGQYLSTTSTGATPTKLIFEVDAAGKVTAWRVGLSPQVDYVEGCS